MLINRSKLALLHVARRQLCLSEDDWRGILGLHGGVASSAALDARGFNAVMARLEQLGFKSTSARKPLPERDGMALPGQTSLIRQLWAECTGGVGTEAALGKWLEKQFKVSSIRFITADLAPRVIAGMRAMAAKRRAAETAA
jgi:hypothetical protein